MYRQEAVKYILAINEGRDESTTVKVVQIYGSATERCSLLRKFLRHTYGLTRLESNRVVVAMGFTDLIPLEQPCMN